MINQDAEFLSKFKWKICIVDEAHRLKNPESKLYITLSKEYSLASRLLLTGTPCQVWTLCLSTRID
jgi:SNF2 family DNA or RNA helicase